MNVLKLFQQQVKAEKWGVWFARRWRSHAAAADASVQAPRLLLLPLPKTVRVLLSVSMGRERQAPSVALFSFLHFVQLCF